MKFKRDTDINKKKYSGLECAISQVQKQPTADVVEVKQGRWVNTDDGEWMCTNCNEYFYVDIDMHPIDDCKMFYCCNCGAKMDGERKCDNG